MKVSQILTEKLLINVKLNKSTFDILPLLNCIFDIDLLRNLIVLQQNSRTSI